MNKISFTPRLQRIILFSVLFLSGLNALIYQIVWIRKFGLVFGVHVYSMSTVLTAFMGGLALGSLLFGRLVDRQKDPLKLFLLLEFGIGIFAVFFPFLFNLLTKFYTAIAPTGSASNYAVQLVRFSLSFVFLLVPSTLMGGTLPVIIKFFVRQLGSLGGKVSRLYSLNNFGALLGCFLAGFFTIRLYGVTASLYIAATLNLLNALLVYLVARSPRHALAAGDESPEEQPVAAGENSVSPWLMKLVLWVFAIEGFTTLAYEVIWSRIMIDFSIDKTTYFSSTIVMGFIAGLSIGSIIISRFIDRSRKLLLLLGSIEAGIGIVSILLLSLYSRIIPWLAAHREMTGTWLANSGKEYLVFFIILTLPTTLMGFTYPLVSKLYTDNIQKLGKRLGLMGCLDTVGSIAGSFVAGFIMVPYLGVVKSFVITVVINLSIGILIFLFHPRLKGWVKTFLVGSPVLISLLIYASLPDKKYTRQWWDTIEFRRNPWVKTYQRLVFFDEGVGGTVTVRKYPDMLSLNINGHNVSYTTPKDLAVNRQLGYMPYILHPDPKNALVIGFGMGVTTGALIQPDMEEIDVAEICPGVIKAADVFKSWNYDAVNDPKVNIIHEDGRSVILSAKKKYDIITSNAIHPRLSNNIYTRDFYRLCREKLTDDGIIVQWTPPNWIRDDEFRSLVKAFVDAFPHSTMWYVNEYSAHIIGSKSPINIDYAQVVRKFENAKLRRDLADANIDSPEKFISQYYWSESELAEYVKGSQTNTDDFPLVEFSRIINIAPDTTFMDLLAGYMVNFDPVLNLPKDTAVSRKIHNMFRFYNMVEKVHISSISNTVKQYSRSGDVTY
jgi:spermidine synthase